MIGKLNIGHLRFVSLFIIIGLLAFLPQTDLFLHQPDQLSIGILLDLCITLPIVYFLFIRNTSVSKVTILYVAVIGLILAGFILPDDQQELLNQVKHIAIPLLEVGIVSSVFFKFRKLRWTFKTKQGRTPDFYDSILRSCEELFPGIVGKLLATEISVIYYLFAPKSKKENDDLAFSYYEKSGIISVIGVFIFLLILETLVVHLLVAEWNNIMAWIITGAGSYTGLQILSIARSMKHRHVIIDKDTRLLHLRFGFSSQVSIPIDEIQSIELTRKTPGDEEIVALSPFHIFDPHNMIIRLNRELTLFRIYGLKKNFSTILFYIDEKEVFKTLIEELQQNT